MQVYFDPKETNFERLLELFFERTDPTTKNRCDICMCWVIQRLHVVM